MRRLELDFLRSRRPPTWASYVLLAVALAFGAELAWNYRALGAEIARKEARLAGGAPRLPDVSPAASRPIEAEELAFARETIRRLGTPWDRLFAMLEAAHSERVALLSIEPEVESGTVTLTAEAKDYLAALSYVANLEAQKGLARVHMTRHESRHNEPQRPLAFTVSASWKERR